MTCTTGGPLPEINTFGVTWYHFGESVSINLGIAQFQMPPWEVDNLCDLIF